MGLRGLSRIVVIAVLAWGLAGCGSDSGAPPLGTLTFITISAPSASLKQGGSEQFMATGFYDPGNGAYTTQDVTSQANWNSLNPGAATITPGGMATAVAGGQTSITASVNGISSIFVLTVVPTYTVGGTLWSLPAASSITLQDSIANGGTTSVDSLAVAANGPFAFPAALVTGETYSVSVSINLAAPSHACTVVDGSGTVASASVTCIQVVCAAATGAFAGNLANGIPSTTGALVNGTGPGAAFNAPAGIALDTLVAGSMYVADSGNNAIRKITSGGAVSTYAGSGTAGYANGSTASSAQFNAPLGVAVDASGNVYVADSGNNAVRMITASGVVSTFAGSPAGAAGYANSPSAPLFSMPSGVAVDASKNVYVADTGNNLIRVITPAGTVSTLAGGGGATAAGYINNTGTAAEFNAPTGVAVDRTGTYLYVADAGNCVIRQIVIAAGTAYGTVSTLAGGAPGSNTCGYLDNPNGTAQFNHPAGVAVDSAKNVWVADKTNNVIRMVSASTASVTTPAGKYGASVFADGPAASAVFNGPYGVAVDASGRGFIGDTGYHLVREYTP